MYMTARTVTDSTQPPVALLLVDSDPVGSPQSQQILDLSGSFPHLVGISWLATMKLLNDLVFSEDRISSEARTRLDGLLSHLFTVERQRPVSNNGTEDPSNDHGDTMNFTKAVLIAAIHGFHGYLVSNNVANIPSFRLSSIAERYKWILDYVGSAGVGGKQKADLDGIAAVLVQYYLKRFDPLPLASIGANTKRLESFLKTVPKSRTNENTISVNAISILTTEDLDAIAHRFNIHGSLLTYDTDRG